MFQKHTHARYKVFYTHFLAMFFTFSNERKPPRPNIPIRTVIRLPISNAGRGGNSAPNIVAKNIIQGVE